MKINLRLLASSFLAGSCIALGGTIFLSIKDLNSITYIVGSLLFAIGLLTICVKQLDLFTGKVHLLIDTGLVFFKFLSIVWIGNLLGALFIASIEKIALPTLIPIADILIDIKMNKSLLDLFILGFICNIFIYIAVTLFKICTDNGKYIGLILAIMGFILCKSEHSIADMYYWFMSSIFYSNILNSLLRIIIISLGNLCGGLFFYSLEKYKNKVN